MSIQTEGSDDDTSTLDSGFDNENVLVETLQSRLYESLKVFLDRGYFILFWETCVFCEKFENGKIETIMY